MSVSGPRFGGETQDCLHFLDTVGRIITMYHCVTVGTHRGRSSATGLILYFLPTFDKSTKPFPPGVTTTYQRSQNCRSFGIKKLEFFETPAIALTSRSAIIDAKC